MMATFVNKFNAIKHKDACKIVVNKHLEEIAKLSSISKPLSSHIASHTFAKMAIDNIKNPMVTLNLLGHKNLAVQQQ